MHLYLELQWDQKQCVTFKKVAKVNKMCDYVHIERSSFQQRNKIMFLLLCGRIQLGQ